MKIESTILKIDTKEEFEFINITDNIKYFIKNSDIRNGFVQIFSKHTTLAIKINEYEKMLLIDFNKFMKEIIKEEDYMHDHIELRDDCQFDEQKNAKGHIKCLILETSQTIPIINKELQLGKYQDIFAIETSGPREREIIVQITGE
jgi:secondary thiamine-phosphate synthase enzyme